MSPKIPSESANSTPNNVSGLLREARTRFSQKEIAKLVGVTAKTVGRWESGASPHPAASIALKAVLTGPAVAVPAPRDFTFVDLFAGIGGIRLGFQEAGGECVFTSEWNDWSRKTYAENFPGKHPFVGDIVEQPVDEVPDHDVLLAGFPCQPFSLAGVSKKNSLGRPHGFECTTQGTLFFDVARIIAAKRPKAFLLENVKNLVSHDGGNTFRVILQTLQEELGYDVHWKVLDAKPWVPQHRERILIVGFCEKTAFSWNDIRTPDTAPTLASVLHPEDGSEPAEERYTGGPKARVHRKYILTDNLWKYLQAYAEKHRLAGNGFGFGLVTRHDVARTLSARYYKDGSEILIRRGKVRNPRRLTPRECARLMGFPDDFRIPVSDTQAYRQFGNSVVVPVMREVARIMAPHVVKLKQQAGTGLLQQELRFA